LNSTCYLCGSKNNTTIFTELDIPILQCKECTHVFSSYEQEEHYDGYWGEDSEETYDLEWWDYAHRKVYHEFIEKFLVKPTGKVLDVGCGLGFFVKTVNHIKPDWEAVGYEMSKSAVNYAKTKNNLSNIHAGMVQESGIPEGSIDVITLWDVIEHIPKPHPLLSYLQTLLKPGGILFIQTPNFPIQLIKARLKVLKSGMREGIHYLEAKDHINDYSRQTLTKLALDTGYQAPEYHILYPIVSVSGGSGNWGKIGKVGFYRLTKFIYKFSLKSIFLNNTLFATVKKG
jgi:2-polyprenyl-3-methyl-5-hydroxy-6-metoxy-1,4-benzoquinol methylase